MSKPELGVKHDCPECGARFYDLNKTPAHCPKCDHEFVPEALLKPRKPRREDEPQAKEEAAKPEAETSLETADKEKKAAESKRKAALDEEGADSDDDDDDELADIKDIEVALDDDDDEDDDSLLDDSDDDDDVGVIVPTKDED